MPLALCFMFTPARYIVYGGHGGGGVDNISRGTESMNYFNLSIFSSRAPSHYRVNSLVQRKDFESDRNIVTEETKSPNFGRQINDYTHPEGPMA